MQLGLYSFAENTPDPLNGNYLQSPAERLKDLLEEIELADQLGRRVDCADGQQALRQMPGSASLNGQAEQVATGRDTSALAFDWRRVRIPGR